MPLLEIIKGEQTSEETLYRALDVAKAIKKTPIVVNDSRGFFTSRVIGGFINEGIAMLVEGIPAPSIEQASSQAGYPAPVLQLSDELNLNLMRKIRLQYQAAAEVEGIEWTGHPSLGVIDRMLDEYDRGGRLAGKGFYEYDEDGKRGKLWSGLRDAFPPIEDPASISLRDLEERMMFAEAIESVKCLDEGVIESVADANIGSIFGIGFPAWTGGVLQYINGYAGGLPGFVARARELAETYGDRFEPPASLVEKGRARRDIRRQRRARRGRVGVSRERHAERRAAGIRGGRQRPGGPRVRHARAARRADRERAGASQHRAVCAHRRARLAGLAIPEAYGGSGGGWSTCACSSRSSAYGQIPIAASR